MDATVFKKKRKEIEKYIDGVMMTLDPSGTNSQYYREIFSKMSDTDFKKFWSKDFPLRFHTKPMEIEPNSEQIAKAAKIVGVPLIRKVKLPYLYRDENGVPVSTLECTVLHTHIKKVQQMVIKKNKNALEIGNRDMRTGRLSGDDKGAAESDREYESLATLSLVATMDELSRPKADAMNAKSYMYNDINVTGQVYLKDIPMEIDDSLGKNMMNVYMMGAHIDSNLTTLGFNEDISMSKTRNIKRL